DPNSRRDRRKRIRDSARTRVMEVCIELSLRKLLPCCDEEIVRLLRVRHAGGIAEHELAHATLVTPPCEIQHDVDGHRAAERTAERGGHAHEWCEPIMRRAVDHRRHDLLMLIVSATE